MAFGLAERSPIRSRKRIGKRRVLTDEWQYQVEQLDAIRQALYQGLSNRSYFVTNPRELFQLRIDIVDVVAQSLLLELQAGGGRGTLANQHLVLFVVGMKEPFFRLSLQALFSCAIS